MNLLINIFGVLVMTFGVLALASVVAVVDFIAMHVNWSLLVVLFLVVLICYTLLKKEPNV